MTRRLLLVGIALAMFVACRSDREEQREKTGGCPPLPDDCTLHCEWGFKTDAAGCEVCECSQTCPDLPAECDVECIPFGYKTDERGCSICECEAGTLPADCAPLPDDCRLHCEWGFVTDAAGCEICECSQTCPELPADCRIECIPFGYKTDERGCTICECATS